MYTHLKILYIYITIFPINFYMILLYWSIPKNLKFSRFWPPKNGQIPPPFHSLSGPRVIPQFRGIPRVDPAITGLPGSYRIKGGPFCSWKMAKFPEWCMHFPLQLIDHWFNDDPHWPPEGFGKNHPTAPSWSWKLWRVLHNFFIATVSEPVVALFKP